MLKFLFFVTLVVAGAVGYHFFTSKLTPSLDKALEINTENKAAKHANKKNNINELSPTEENSTSTLEATTRTTYPELRQGFLPDESYFYAIHQYMEKRLREEIIYNPKLKLEYEKSVAYKTSGYMEYDNSTLFSLVESGDSNAAIVLLTRPTIEKPERLSLLTTALQDKDSFPYHVYATHIKNSSLEESEAYLIRAYQLGSEMAGFNLTLNEEARKANGLSLNKRKLEEYLIIAQSEL